MPEITPETLAVLTRAAASTGFERDKHLVDAVIAALKADPAFAAPTPTWQERAAAAIAQRYYGDMYDEHGIPETDLRRDVLAVLAESAPPPRDPEAHAALLRLVRAAAAYRQRVGGSWAALDDAYLALPASVREEAGR